MVSGETLTDCPVPAVWLSLVSSLVSVHVVMTASMRSNSANAASIPATAAASSCPQTVMRSSVPIALCVRSTT
jgi:hypothetical protein